MESYKSVSVIRRYFNFPELCTDQAWLARKTQYWADASVLGYKNTSSSFSCHFSQSPAFIWNLCKVFRKQSWADGQTKSLKDSGVSHHWQQHKKSHTLLKQPFTTDCSTRRMCFACHLGHDPGRQLDHLGCGRELISTKHGFMLSAQVFVLQSIIWQRLTVL